MTAGMGIRITPAEVADVHDGPDPTMAIFRRPVPTDGAWSR
ncbi:hypothetical protein ABIA38_006700 [Embleya sp. AB8]